MRFRCAVTPVKMTRSMTAASSVTLYSEPANGGWLCLKRFM